MKRIVFLLLFVFSIGFSQDKTDSSDIISSKSCECISKISSDHIDKNKAIKNCIDESIIATLKTDIASNDQNTTEIRIEQETYNRIEKNLIENCESLKKISFSENTKFEHASSTNVLAQLAYDDGMDYLEEKDYLNAITKFEKAINIDSTFAFAWDNLGISYRNNEQYDKAIAAYKKSLEINPKGRMPLINIAVAYNLNNDFNQAIKYYKDYIEFYPDDAEGYYGLGIIQYTIEEYENGLDNLIHAYSIYTAQNSPYRADAGNKIGFMYNDLKKKGKLEIFNTVASRYNLKIDTQ